MTDHRPQNPPHQIEALKKATEKTRFGQPGANPQSHNAGGNKPWSIRNSMRYLSAQKINTGDAKPVMTMLGDRATVAQVIAAKQLENAIAGESRSAEFVTEQVDGKLAQTNLNADFTAIQGMSDDELRDIVRRADSASEGGGGDTGTPAPGGSPVDDAREAEGPVAATDSTSV